MENQNVPKFYSGLPGNYDFTYITVTVNSTFNIINYNAKYDNSEKLLEFRYKKNDQRKFADDQDEHMVYEQVK